jgi:hypothetical protein
LGKGDAHKMSWGDYWNGHVFSYDWFRVLSIFIGFFGLDHLILRSPSTAISKFVVNALTFGSWFFYDLIQLWLDEETVIKYGLSTPFGPKGLGYKFFDYTTTNPELKKNVLPTPSDRVGSSFRYILYFLLAFIPFGLSELMGGDYSGGIMRMLFGFFWFIFIPWQIMQLIKAPPDEVYQKGIARPYIISWFLGNEYGPPRGLVREQLAVQITRETGLFTKIFELYKLIFKITEPVVKPVIESTVAPVATAVAGAASAVGAAASGVCLAEQTAATVTRGVAGAVGTVGQIATEVPSKLGAAMNPAAAVAAASGSMGPPKDFVMPPRGTMVGGGESASSWDSLILGTVGLLVAGGFGFGLLRKRNESKRSNDYPQDAYGGNDAPPNPGTV